MRKYVKLVKKLGLRPSTESYNEAVLPELREGAVDSAKSVADLWTQNPHYCNDNDGYERENNRILDQTLTFFFRSE
jgi:hypothetical protein